MERKYFWPVVYGIEIVELVYDIVVSWLRLLLVYD